MPRHWLGNPRRTALAKCDLNSGVAIGFDGFHLRDTVVRHVEHCHWHGIAVVSENAHHAYFPSQEA
jgi:hypothetical protein